MGYSEKFLSDFVYIVFIKYYFLYFNNEFLR